MSDYWIKTRDGLPDETGYYVVVIESDILLARWNVDENKWMVEWDDKRRSEVFPSHWLSGGIPPLPPFPKVGPSQETSQKLAESEFLQECGRIELCTVMVRDYEIERRFVVYCREEDRARVYDIEVDIQNRYPNAVLNVYVPRKCFGKQW